MNDLLFIYGTLLDEDNAYAAFLKQNSKVYAQGKIKGKLYDIGEYPGAVAANDTEYVYGIILQLNDPEKVLPVIDDYEGFGDEQEKPNLFVRVLILAETSVGEIICWIYFYNRPIHNLTPIVSGRYIK